MIIKNSATPLYQQLFDALKRDILDGKLKEEAKLMTEQELSEHYQVSRITVRKAIELLAEEGYVVKKQGIGTFVAAKKLNRTFDQVRSFTEICEADGKKASAILLFGGWTKADISVAKQMKINEGDKVIRIFRVRQSDGKNVMLEDNYFDDSFGYLLEGNLTNSIYEIIRKHGVIPKHAVKTVGICYARAQEAELLEVPLNQALLLHKELAIGEDGDIIHYCKQVVNPERYTLTILC